MTRPDSDPAGESGVDLPGIHDLEAAGLYDPRSASAPERLELLGYLGDAGVTLEEMISCDAEGRLAASAGDRLLRRGQPRLTLAEVAEVSGIPEERIRSMWRASGFPDPPPDARPFWPEDAETFRLFEAGAEFINPEAIGQFTRVIGTSLARIADATVALFLTNVELPLVTGESREMDLAQASREGIEKVDTLPLAFDTLFRHHVEAAIRRALSSWERVRPTAVHCLGFVDLVGSTPLTEGLDHHGISTLVGEFEQVATDLVTAEGGRIVKAIGDEVMYYTVDPVATCEIALDLVEHAESHDRLSSARAGLNVGPVVWQDGDCYGPVVNVASRLVELASPGEVLGTEAIAEAVGGSGRFRLVPLGARRLRGVSAPVSVFAVERA